MSLSDLISIGMTLGTGIIILANIILMNLVAYYREEQDSLKVFCISLLGFYISAESSTFFMYLSLSPQPFITPPLLSTILQQAAFSDTQSIII